MHRTECAMSLIQQEIDRSQGDRLKLISILNDLNAQERKNILRFTCGALRRHIIQKKEFLCQAYAAGKCLSKRLSGILARINIRPGRCRRLSSLPIARTFRHSILEIADSQAEKELHDIFVAVADLINSRCTSEAEELSVRIRLLHRVGRSDEINQTVIRAYETEVPVYMRNIIRQWTAEDSKNILRRIESLQKIPGLFNWTNMEYLPRETKYQVQQYLGDAVFDEGVLGVKEILVLLQEKEKDALSLLMSNRISKAFGKRLQSALAEALLEYAGIQAYNLLQIRQMEWPADARRKIFQLTRKLFKKAVKKTPNSYAKLLVEKIKSSPVKEIRKEEVPFLRIIAEEVSSTKYFENNLCVSLVRSLLCEENIQPIQRAVRVISSKWKYPLRMRVAGLIRDFSEAETLQNGAVSLVHTNSFRWPKLIEQLNLPGMPEISKIKQKIEQSRKRQKVKMEWVDTLSTVEIEVDSESAILSFPQYWLIQQLCENKEFPLSRFEALPLHREQMEPLLKKGIIQVSSDSQKIRRGNNFNKPTAWTDLLPDFAAEAEEDASDRKKVLLNMAADSYLVRELKTDSPQEKSVLISRLIKSHGIPLELADKRLNILLERNFLVFDKQAGTLSYNP
ncbi:hypothetical protein NEAUS06_1568 [Nematocida ausubeli]|nr:hypothetical protein NEAUS06_1568 [Nematocida ausubeli]